jgi:phosphate transport system substrate-binding protein
VKASRIARATAVAAALTTTIGLAIAAVPAHAAPGPPHLAVGGSDTTEQLMTAYATSQGEFNIPALPGAGGFNVPAEGGQCDTNADGNVNWDRLSPPGERVAPNGSSAGITELNNVVNAGLNCLDVARSSRGPRATDDARLTFYNYALDAIWVMTPGWYAPTSLSKQEVKDIFLGSPVGTCSVTNWSQVGGANYPITTYIPQAGSGTRAEFLNRWLDMPTDPGVNGFPCVPATRQNNEENTGKAAGLLSGTTLPGAITAYSAGKWVRQGNNPNNATIDNRNGMHPVLLDEPACGATPASPIVRTAGGSWSLNTAIVTPANAAPPAAGLCPGVRFLWNVVRDDAPQIADTNAFVGVGSPLCLGAAGPQNGTIRGQGFLPNVCSAIKP